MLSDLEAVQDIDVIVISGDIADDGSKEAYHAARELIGEFARSRNVPMIYSTGNEDERLAFSEVLGSGHLDATGHDRVELILCGHFHMQIFGYLESAAVWVTPGVVTRIDLTAAVRTERAVRGASATIAHLGTPHSPLLHVLHARDPQVGETVYELDERQVSAAIEKLGP